MKKVERIKTPVRATVKYTVPQYLGMLEKANRSPKTITGYKKIFQMYGKFLGVPLDEIHNHLSVGNLLEFSDSRKGMSPQGTKTALSVLHRYFHLNGVEFDELEFNVMNKKVVKEHNDKPLTLESLQKMMDLTDAHGRSLLSFLVSTGCRAGELTQLLLSDIGRMDGETFVPDISGDVINIRNEIAKAGHGGHVFLTSEAREFLTLWLKERADYLAIADKRMEGLVKAGAHRRQDNDNRIFGTTYTSLHKWFTRLYEKVDGEQGKYHNSCTLHSCRKYFRTTAARTMHPDLVTNLMRQTGYLDNTYVRMPVVDKMREFHDGEAGLYLTRADHRVQSGELATMRRELAAYKETDAQKKAIESTPEFKAAMAAVMAMKKGV